MNYILLLRPQASGCLISNYYRYSLSVIVSLAALLRMRIDCTVLPSNALKR